MAPRSACLLLYISLLIHGVSATENIALELVASGFPHPTFVTHAGDGSGRLFVAQKAGAIRVVESDGRVRPIAFLDLSPSGSNRVLHPGPTGENGLLGLAFHPDYKANGRFFVHYSVLDGTRTGDGIVAEYRVSADANIAETTERVILEIDQPSWNHNGGMIAFSPVEDCSSCLYIGLGDGGGSADAFQNGQNKNTLLASILRIDVDSGDPYRIPEDNPFVGKDGADEIYCYGLRNPWRFSFDPMDGRLFIGDVGELSREEVNIAGPGDNLGWSRREGNVCFNPGLGCLTDGLTPPIAEYTHSEGKCSIIGGYVYRGNRVPTLAGEYFFGDFCSGQIWSIRPEYEGKETWSAPQLRASLGAGSLLSSFGVDEEGEILVVQLDSRDGNIYRIAVPRDPERADLVRDGKLDANDLFEWVRQFSQPRPSEESGSGGLAEKKPSG